MLEPDINFKKKWPYFRHDFTNAEFPISNLFCIFFLRQKIFEPIGKFQDLALCIWNW